MTTAAAQALIDRALQAEQATYAYMLIDSAARLDPSIDTAAIKNEWLENWMERTHKLLTGKE